MKKTHENKMMTGINSLNWFQGNIVSDTASKEYNEEGEEFEA